jgi:hypothetical protein
MTPRVSSDFPTLALFYSVLQILALICVFEARYRLRADAGWKI